MLTDDKQFRLLQTLMVALIAGNQSRPRQPCHRSPGFFFPPGPVILAAAPSLDHLKTKRRRWRLLKVERPLGSKVSKEDGTEIKMAQRTTLVSEWLSKLSQRSCHGVFQVPPPFASDAVHSCPVLWEKAGEENKIY